MCQNKEAGKVLSEAKISMCDNPLRGQKNTNEIKKFCHLYLGLEACLASCYVNVSETTYKTLLQTAPSFENFFQ